MAPALILIAGAEIKRSYSWIQETCASWTQILSMIVAKGPGLAVARLSIHSQLMALV